MATLTASGITFGDSTQLNSKTGIFPTNTNWVFYQASAPTGWTKQITHDNKALRVVSGNGGGSAGTNSFTTTMTNFVLSGPFTSSDSTGGTGLDLTQISSHDHLSNGVQFNAVPSLFNPNGSFVGWNGGDVTRAVGWTRATNPATGPGGGTGPIGDAHFHPFSGTATLPSTPVSIDVQYVDVIVCSFNG
jgi:hypothetical protein